MHASAQAQVWLFQPAIATDDLAASSCFQKRLRQLVNLSEKGKRNEGKKTRGGPRTQAACTCTRRRLAGHVHAHVAHVHVHVHVHVHAHDMTHVHAHAHVHVHAHFTRRRLAGVSRLHSRPVLLE